MSILKLFLNNTARLISQMALYVVRAKPIRERLGNLRKELDSGDVSRLEPFGRELHKSLVEARIDKVGYAFWVEEDYCSPPLAMERQSVLDRYFEDLSVERVASREVGNKRIRPRTSLWQ
jgi:hypothetical protein